MECTSQFPRMCSPYSFHLKDNETIPVITVFRWEQGCERPSHALASPFHISSPLRYSWTKSMTPRPILAFSLARPPPPRRLPSLLPDRRLPWSHALGMALHQRYNHKVMWCCCWGCWWYWCALGMDLHQWYDHQVSPATQDVNVVIEIYKWFSFFFWYPSMISNRLI